MNISKVLYTLGTVLGLFAILLLLPLGISFCFKDIDNIYKHREVNSFLITIAISLVAGGILRLLFFSDRKTPIGIREGFAIVTFVWLSMALFGCLPFYLSGVCDSFTDAYFETMSGLTTTGSTILTQIESLPHGLLFWRSFTQFLGGMGIIILALAILPLLGIGGYHLFRLDAPGGSSITKLQPRFTEVARTLWTVYIMLTVFLIFLLLLGGMSLFEATCHSFTTLSTGGFSTRTDSIGAFNSPYISYVIIVFMFIAGCSFLLHYRILCGKIKEIYRDPQAKFFFLMLLISIMLMVIFLLPQRPSATFEETFRQAAFQVVSLGTSTGFTTTDFSKFPAICLLILIMWMLLGGCAGSTAGAIKQIRIMVLLKLAFRELTQLIRPRQVIPIKVNSKVIHQEALNNIIGFFLLYLITLGVAAFILTGLGENFLTACSAVISAMGNIGPALGDVTANYSGLPITAKWVLILCMLIGRLEIFAVWVLFTTLAWRK